MKYIIAMALACLCAPITFVSAQGLGQDAPVNQLDTLLVEGEGGRVQGSATSPTVQQAKNSLKEISGGIGFVETEEYEDQFIQSLGDTLVFTPGVFADTSAQRESRISIRGSGLNATFERRGISVFRDGVPISRASGITEFQEVDPISVKYLEVYKGANAARLGVASLGGAINVVTPTGQNTKEGVTIRMEGGSFGTTRVNTSAAGKNGDMDYYASFTKLDSDGFRAHSDVDSLYGFTNVGFKLSDRVETRFYLTHVGDRFELAGSVSQQEALDNPETAVQTRTYPTFLGGGPFSSVDDDWDRNLIVRRFSNKTNIQFDHVQLDVSLWATERTLDHAINRFAGVIDQREDEFGFSSQINNANTSSTTQWSLGLTTNKSDNDARRWRNVLGERTTLVSADVQRAENAALFGHVQWALTDRLKLTTGGLYHYALREEDGTGRQVFNGFSPSLGLLGDLNEHSQWYANISRSYEPPGITDLTSGGASDFDPLLAQEAVTLEVGTRGQGAITAWDISVYYSELENELIDSENPTSPGNTITTNSTSDTVHRGLELGFDVYPEISALDDAGLSFAWKNSLTVNDFYFDNHETFGDNTLAGVPDTIYITELRVDSVDDWYAGLNVRYLPDGPYLDFANTTQVNGYTLLGLTAGVNVSNGLRIFASVENLADRRYISNVSTVFEGDASDTNFTPGQGCAAYIGFSYDL